MSKKKKAKLLNNSIDGKFISFKDRIRFKKNKTEELSKLKLFYDYKEIETYIKKLAKIPEFKKYISGLPFPKNARELKEAPRLMITHSLDRELYWNACILSMYTNEINTFIRLREKFECFLLNGDYRNAKFILDKIEEELGFSIWLLENRIALIEESEGIEKQKEFVKSTNTNHIVSIMTYVLSVRAEKNVSYAKYESYIRKSIYERKREFHEHDINYYFTDYILFKLQPFSRLVGNYSNVLYFESDSSIIDRYLTFIKVGQIICSDSGLEKYLISLQRAISLIINKIDDYQINNICYYLGINSCYIHNDKSFNIIDMLDCYNTGRYQKCAEICPSYILKNPTSIEFYEIYIKSKIKLNEYNFVEKFDCIKDKIISYMVDIVVKNERAKDSFCELLKLIYIYSSHSWAIQLFMFLVREFHDDNPDITNFYITFGELNSYLHNPRQAMIFKETCSRMEFYSRLIDTYGDSYTVTLFKALISEKETGIATLEQVGLPLERYKKYKAQILRIYNCPLEAIDIYEELLNSEDFIIHQDAVTGLIRCYILTNMLDECLELMVSEILKNEKIVSILPLKELLDIIETSKDIDLSGNISLPIAYDIYTKYIESDKDIIKAEVCEDFLFSHNLDKPSKIIKYIEQIEKVKLVYFLKNVCIPQVLDSSPTYNSTEEIEKERMAVCQLLVTLDPQNSDVYSEEIKSITQRLIIKNGIREIEQSKIYVNVEGIKKSIEKTFKESYNRYLSLPNFNEGEGIDNHSKKLRDMGIDLWLTIPRNEKYELFITMVCELRDAFVSSNEYGLDGYLSTGIRHGTLLSKLRNPIEVNYLITQKDNITGIYKDNEYWKNKYYGINVNTLTQLLTFLADFSRQIDELIELLRGEWIQIKTEEKGSKGLFDFTINRWMFSSELNAIKLDADVSSNYEEFVDIILNKLWEMTDISLERIRNEISTNLKCRFNSVFDILQQDISLIEQEVNFKELHSFINKSRTSIQYELDKIANWFKRSRESEINEYDISLPIDIGIEMIKNIYQSRTINLIIGKRTKCNLKGKTLKSFVDIVFILLDNIVKHCKIEDTAPEVKIEFFHEDEILYFVIENEISKDINIENSNEKLEQIRKALAEGKYMDNVRKEGGSGFHKIGKILRVDLKCSSEIDFSFSKNFTFKVVIRINVKGLKV